MSSSMPPSVPRPNNPLNKPPVRKRRDLMAGREKEIWRWTLVAIAACIVAFFVTLPDVRKIAKAAPGTAIQIFDRHDALVVTIDGDEEREFVPLKNIPKVSQQALLAAEDHNFYKHNGISFRGIARAFMNNAEAGRVVEGGSTITQQLAKNLFFETGDRSILRKIREAVLAVEIEKAYSKDQILEMYFNQVYFGRSAYGLERASMRYFGKSARNLNLAESAFLMGLLKAPSHLGNPDNVKDAKERQHLVIDEMQQLGYINAAQAQSAKATKLAFSRSNRRLTKFPYYMSAVQQFLNANIEKKRLEKGGLRIYTNLDPVAQRLAERTVAQRVRDSAYGMNQCALVSQLVEDGSVVALVGGAGDYWKHQWNSATSPHTMGSSFKPFVYLSGFMQGKFTPESIIDDSPIVIPQTGAPDWVPKNFDGEFYGPMTVREAIALSRNICAVRAAVAAGLGHVVETARSAGIKSELHVTPALALGASAASPLEMSTAYATIARGGSYLAPSLVRRVEGRDGFVQEFKYYPEKVFPDSPVRALLSCMESVVKEGTGVAARLRDRPVAGKTGTSDEARDLWFVGFTPHMVTAVWGGNDQHRSLGGLTGGAVLTGIWRVYNEQYYKTHRVPAGTFYTERLNTNDNAWDYLLKDRREVEDQLKEQEQQEQQQQQDEQNQLPEQEQQQPDQQQNNPFGLPQLAPPLPGAPTPGHVRRPNRPMQNDEFGVQIWGDREGNEPAQFPGEQGTAPYRQPGSSNGVSPDQQPGVGYGARPEQPPQSTPNVPQPAPDIPMPAPAPERQQPPRAPQPAPEPIPAPSVNNYDDLLREPPE